MIIANNPYITHPAGIAAIVKAGTNVFVNETSTDPNGITLSHTLVSGNDRGVYAILMGEGSGLDTALSATYGGNAMTLVGVVQQSTSWAAGFYILEANLPADGARDCVTTHTSYSGSSLDLYIGQLNNTQYDNHDIDGGGSFVTLSNTVNPSYNGSYTISGFITGSSGASVISENESQVQLLEGLQSGHRISIAELEDVPTGSITLTSSYASPAHHLCRVVLVFAPKQ